MSEFHGYSQKMMNCIEILINSARKVRKKAENSGIGAKFYSFISFFQSHPSTAVAFGDGAAARKPIPAPALRSAYDADHGASYVAALAAAWLSAHGITNFRRLVLGCIDSYDCEKRRILQHFSRSTRCAFFCTAQISTFAEFLQFFSRKFPDLFCKILRFFCDKCQSKSEHFHANLQNFRY